MTIASAKNKNKQAIRSQGANALNYFVTGFWFVTNFCFFLGQMYFSNNTQQLCSADKIVDSSPLKSLFCQTFWYIWNIRSSNTDQHGCSFSDQKYWLSKTSPYKSAHILWNSRQEKWFEDQEGVTVHPWPSVTSSSYSSRVWSWRQLGNFK